MLVKKDQNKLETYLKKKLLQQNFIIFLRTSLIKESSFLKKKDIILNEFNFINILNFKLPLSIKLLHLNKKETSYLYIIKNEKTIFKKKKDFYFNKLNYFLKLWFNKRLLLLNNIWYKKVL